MRSSRARTLDTKKPIHVYLNTNIESEADDQQKKQFYHDEPNAEDRFFIPIIIPVINEIERPYPLHKYTPPHEHYIQYAYINYNSFMYETHYNLDEVDFEWLEEEQARMREELQFSKDQVIHHVTSTANENTNKNGFHPKNGIGEIHNVNSWKNYQQLSTGRSSNFENSTENSNEGRLEKIVEHNTRISIEKSRLCDAVATIGESHHDFKSLADGKNQNIDSKDNDWEGPKKDMHHIQLENRSTDSYTSIVTEDILEDFIDRLEKIMGKNQCGFPKLCDIEPYVPKQFAQITNIADIAARIHIYWKDRRKSRISKEYPLVGKPLLRHFQIPPDIDDDDPRLAFRPRDKDLSSKAPFPNNEEAVTRLKLMHEQLTLLHKLVWNIKKREKIHQEYIENCYQILEHDVKFLLQSDIGVSKKRKRPPIDAIKLENSHTYPLSKVLEVFKRVNDCIPAHLLQVNRVAKFPNHDNNHVLDKRGEYIMNYDGTLLSYHHEDKNSRTEQSNSSRINSSRNHIVPRMRSKGDAFFDKCPRPHQDGWNLTSNSSNNLYVNQTSRLYLYNIDENLLPMNKKKNLDWNSYQITEDISSNSPSLQENQNVDSLQEPQFAKEAELGLESIPC